MHNSSRLKEMIEKMKQLDQGEYLSAADPRLGKARRGFSFLTVVFAVSGGAVVLRTAVPASIQTHTFTLVFPFNSWQD